jgi:PAS domain S-box-containing protein
MERTFDRSILFGVIVIVTLLLGSAVLGWWNTSRLEEEAALVGHTHEVLEHTADVLRILVDAETSERGFIITGQEEYLQPYHAAKAGLENRLATLQEMTRDNARQQQRIQRLRDLATVRMSLLQKAIDLRRKGLEEVQVLAGAGKGRAQMDAIRQVIAEMDRDERDLLQQRQVQSQRAYVLAQTGVLLTAVLGLLVFAAFCWLLHRSLASRQKASALLLRHRQWLHTTLASIGDGVIATDAGGRVTFLNPVAEKLTGWSQADATGRPLPAVFHIVNEQTRQSVSNPAVRAMAEGMVVGLANHTLLIAKSGEERPIDDSAAPLLDEHGHVAGAVLVFRDATAKRLQESELRSSGEQQRLRADQLAGADQRKDEFLAMLAHELRGPLAPLCNMLEVLKRAGDDRQLVEQAHATMARQLAQMVRLVDDLLDVSRITRGRLQLRKGRIDLAAVLNQAVEACQPLAEGLQHKLNVSVPGDAIDLDGDPARLAQAFGNLLNNACKYTPQGGQIRLTAEKEGGEAVVSVKDNGIGISAEMLSHIFEMFTQADRTLERSHGGLGIGLALAKQLVEMHGGSVTASSAGPGQGSEFVVRLPILAAQPASTPSAEPPTRPALLPRRILVVDDNQDTAASLVMLLQQDANEIRAAYDGPEAIQTAQQFRPDVVLLDIGLPNLNGYDVARHIRAQPWGRNMLLVALTGWGQGEDRRKSKEAGFDYHLVKPVKYGSLVELFAARQAEMTR